MKILYLGHASGESLGQFLVKALRQLGQELFVMDTNTVAPRYETHVRRVSTLQSVHRINPGMLGIARKALSAVRKLYSPLVLRQVHDRLWRNALEFRPDLLFVVRGHWLNPGILQDIKRKVGCAAVFYHSEDFMHPTYYSQRFLQAIPLYDCIFTVIRSNIQEYHDLHAQRVEYLPFGYDPEVHRPVSLRESERNYYGSEVAFLGKWSSSRQELLERLTGTCQVAVWGYMWERVPLESSLHGCLKGAVSLSEIARVIAGSKIMLNTLNDQGRMQHVMRTFEIPACGGFQIAKRTDEHLAFFDEDREIVCFETLEELSDKTLYYLTHDTERERIRKAGYERVMKDHHSYVDRMKRVLQVANEI